jgi:phosphoribosylamine--glycine ligase
MDILIVGGGGREHAIAKKLAESPLCGKLYAAPGNGGIAELADCVPIPATDLEALPPSPGGKKVDYVVVAPDDPLVLGLVDLLAARGISAFGPSRPPPGWRAASLFQKLYAPPRHPHRRVRNL